jgi:ABC-type sugar transport system substrate-binding protein
VNAIEKYCPGCEIVETIGFLGGEIGPDLQSKAEQALLKHPEATAVSGPYEDPVVNAILPAIQNAGRSGQVSAFPGESSVNATELLEEGKIQAIVGQDNSWEGFMSFDAVARVLANQDPAENEASGMGLQLVDAENNAPESGQIWKIKGIDYRKAFESAWLK